jgi:hypothetical protein
MNILSSVCGRDSSVFESPLSCTHVHQHYERHFLISFDLCDVVSETGLACVSTIVTTLESLFLLALLLDVWSINPAPVVTTHGTGT